MLVRLAALSASASVAVVVLAGCQAASSAAALKVGDCYTQTAGVDANGDSAVQFAATPCAQPHDGEVFSVFDYPNASSFPGYEAIGALQQTRCQADFVTYVGVEWQKSSYTIAYSSPDERSWSSGDHSIRCMVTDASAGKLTGSVKGSKK